MKYWVVLAVVVGLSGCNTAMIMPATGEVAEKEVQIKASKVDLTLAKRNHSIQKKKGITIGLEPINTEPEPYYKVSLKEKLQLLVVNGKQSYDVTHMPYYKNQDGRVSFRLKVSNNTDRVLRSKGAIVSIDVDGQTKTIPSSAYQSLTGLILVPNSTKEIVIQGPDVSSIKGENGVLRVGVYEIGVGDQYANFEWYIDYNTDQVSQTLPMKVQSESMLPSEAKRKHGSIYAASNL